MNITKGSYISQDMEYLLIYIKLSKIDLIKALPLTEITSENYIIAIFYQGLDYLKAGYLHDIENTITQYNMFNLIMTDYNSITNTDIREQSYINKQLFAKSQLNL